MTWIIDGHNLIGAIPGMDLSELDDESRLIDWLLHFLNVSQTSAQVFFDKGLPGRPAKRKQGRLTVNFVRQGTADDAISRHLDKLAEQAKNFTVVSSDRQVQASAKFHHSRVMSSAKFVEHALGRLSRKKTDGQEPSISTEELDHWMKMFNSDQDPR